MCWTNKETRNAYYRERYRKYCEFIHNLKVMKGCADCGYNKHHAGLEFDHLDGRLRDTVASLMGRSLKIILEEVARCEVVCGTCHNIRTWNRKQNVHSSTS